MKALLALVVIPFAVVACGGSPNSDEGSTSTATSAQSTTSNVSGHWVNSTPCNTTFYSPGTGHLKCDGYTNWSGVFVGTSHYFFDGYVASTGDISGSLSETFTGTGLGTSGTFHMTEQMTINGTTGAIHIDSTIDSGTGGFSTLRGNLTFDGTSTSSGIGSGSYVGTVTY